MLDESARLLALQQQLESEADGKVKFFGLSINETIRMCILNGSKRTEKVKSDFKVADKRFVIDLLQDNSDEIPTPFFGFFFLPRFWYIKLYALTESRDFEALDTFAKSKRSPIGYEPFVRHLLEKGYSKEAIPYVTKCDSSKRADLYVECGEWRLAGRECKERNDKAKLE